MHFGEGAGAGIRIVDDLKSGRVGKGDDENV